MNNYTIEELKEIIKSADAQPYLNVSTTIFVAQCRQQLEKMLDKSISM